MKVTLTLSNNATYRAILLEGGLDKILALPSMVAPDTNDWGDEDWVEVDTISANRLEVQELSVPLWFEGSGNPFPAVLSSPSVRMAIASEGSPSSSIEVSVRPKRIEDLEKTPMGWAGTIICTRQETATASSANWAEGLTILESANYTGAHMSPERKDDPQVDDPASGISYYDGGRTYRGAYTLEIPVLLKADSLSALWGKRRELLSRLVDRGLRTIPSITGHDSPKRGYYSSSSSTEVFLAPGGGLSLSMTLSFTITQL